MSVEVRSTEIGVQPGANRALRHGVGKYATSGVMSDETVVGQTYTMSIADHYQTFLDAVTARDNSARWDALVAARHYLKDCDNDDWAWFETSLDDDDRKWFVAAVFSRESLPKRLLPAMVRAAQPSSPLSGGHERQYDCLPATP